MEDSDHQGGSRASQETTKSILGCQTMVFSQWRSIFQGLKFAGSAACGGTVEDDFMSFKTKSTARPATLLERRIYNAFGTRRRPLMLHKSEHVYAQ